MDKKISKWWGNFVGGCDDSFLLLDYFGTSQNETLDKILQDLHLDTLISSGTLESGDAWFSVNENYEPHFDMPINAVIDLSAIVAECLYNGQVTIKELDSNSKYEQIISIKANEKDIALLKKGLDMFINSPEKFDLYDFLDEDDLRVLLTDCKEISKELANL